VQTATRGVKSDIFETLIADPERTYKKLLDLKDDTEYEVTIWALTAAGRGQPKIIVEVTVPGSGRSIFAADLIVVICDDDVVAAGLVPVLFDSSACSVYFIGIGWG